MGYVKPLQSVTVIVLLFLLCGQTLAQDNWGLSIGGYGELHYNQIIIDAGDPGERGELDFHRFGILAGYRVNDLVSIQSELQLTHGMLSSEDNGDLSVIQAYVDLRPMRELGVRAGIVPVPVGIVNLDRNPSSYHGVERTGIETWLIPTTWREAGFGVFGDTDFGLRYQAYALAGLRPDGITGATALREARQNGVQASAANIAATARVDYRVNPMFEVGLSYYFSTLNRFIRDNATDPKVPALADAFYNLAEGHFQLKYRQLEARGLVMATLVSDVEDLNSTYGNLVGQHSLGGYVELAYNVLPHMVTDTNQELFVFARFESFDTHFKTIQLPRNNEFQRFEYTAGLTYRPVPQVAIKADIQRQMTAGDRDIWQVNGGVVFGF